MVHEERMQKRKQDLDFEHDKLLKQQEELMHNLEMMIYPYK